MYRTYSLCCLPALILCLLQHQLYAQDSLKNLPEYSLPLTTEKLVIAHCMTGMITYKGHPLEDSGNPAYYAPKNNSSAPLGGLTQVKVMADSLMSTRSLDEAVAFEMRAAIRSGIDGFQFYYVLGIKDWDNIIKAYFRVADQQKLKFKFTFCIAHPTGKTEALRVQEYAERMNGILDEVGRTNEHWLRTPDGRLVIYQWDGEGLADIPADPGQLPIPYYISKAYQRLANAVHERFACVFTINREITDKALNEFLDYFPATWIWTLPYNSQQYIGERIASVCRERKRTFTASIFNDFYTSKLLKKGTWEMYHHVGDAVKAGLGQVERKYITTGLSYNFRKLLEFGIAQDAEIINVITWNDYPEGHHLAPEINHNEGFSILLNYYKSLWKGEPSPYADRDVAIVFFKKYRHDVVPHPFNIPVKAFQKEVIPAEWEDSIELVTLLKAPAEVKLNGKHMTAGEGLSVLKFPMRAGRVSVNITRNNQRTVKFLTPEGITAFPYRSDRITYTFSSEFDRFYKDLYPGFKPSYSTEYNNTQTNN